MPYVTAQDIISNALFGAGETVGSSRWDSTAYDYLNRAYKAIANGKSEFLPEFIHDWWWLRDRGVLTINPVITGTVAVTNADTAITFSSAPSISFAGRRIRIGNTPDVFKVAAHTGGATDATLDSEYTGDTSSAESYTAMQFTYSLESDVNAIMSPITTFTYNPTIYGLTPERMDRLFPLVNMRGGIPRAFSLEDTRTIRLSHGGRTDGKTMRFEYIFRPEITTLISSSEPLMPEADRHVLADAVKYQVMMDKNDNRASGVGAAVRASLAAMARDNRRRLAKMDDRAGKIIPRQGSRHGIQTESGLVIDRGY